MKKLIVITTSIFMVLASLIIGGCVKEENNQYPDVVANSDTISGILKYKQSEGEGGKIVAWPHGAATLKVIAGSSEAIASAPVNADGTFTVVLPGTMSGSFLSSLADIAVSQGGTVEATPNTVRFLNAIQYKVEYTNNGIASSINTNLYKLKADNSIDKSYFFNFYDSDGTFTGTATYGNVFNWTFNKGWGFVESYVISATGNAFNSKSVDAIPANAVWVNY